MDGRSIAASLRRQERIRSEGRERIMGLGGRPAGRPAGSIAQLANKSNVGYVREG